MFGGVLALAVVDNVLNLFNVEFLLSAIPQGSHHPGRRAGQAKKNLREVRVVLYPGEHAHNKGSEDMRFLGKLFALGAFALLSASLSLTAGNGEGDQDRRGQSVAVLRLFRRHGRGDQG